MFGRPRCREWTPLATQQLRLRSLIQIVGYNIRPPEWCVTHCSFYVTLHHTTMSAPFYTSERISSPHPKWKEIDSEITQCMSSTNVVIRIWCHIPVLSKEIEDQDDKPQDAVIQTWGVYFSGLRYIGANLALNFTSDSFKSNTLVFQMHGGYFCSYKSLKLDVIPPENELEHGSLSSDSSGKISLYKNSLEPKFIQNHKLLKESRSISPCKYGRTDKEYSKSHSPVERSINQNFHKMKTSASLNISKSQREICYRKKDECDEDRNIDPHQIYEHSPDNLDIKEFTSRIDCNNLSKNASNEELCGSKIDLSETAESYDLRNETDGSPKYRYLALSFLKSEIRPSYNASKLQKLHLLQYSIKKRQEAVQEIKERIYKKSALNDCWSPPNEQNLQPKMKSRSQKNLFTPEETDLNKKPSTQKIMNIKNGSIADDKAQLTNSSRLNLKLSDLLSYKAKPSPLQIAEHLRLTKQLEILRFKRIILADERDTKLANIRRLKEKHAKLSEENQDLGKRSDLMECYHNLSKNNEVLKETRQSCGALLELAARSHATLANRRSQLLGQLRQIFLIEERDTSNWTICEVPLPICDDDNHRNLNPVSDAVAAGLVAQATFLAAVLLNQPLRYKLTLLGSASKILDITPDLPDPNIPLYARGGDVTLFRYGMFLLNKCIAQLLWGRGAPVTDMRPTLANLHRLLTKPSNLSDTSKLFGAYKWLAENRCARTQSLRSMVASDRGKYRQFNRFKDSVDGQSPQSVMNLRRHRHSKSVGSCNDDQDIPALDASTTSLMGSAPNIYNAKLMQTNSDSADPLKTHSSDSEISKLTDNRVSESGSRVVFTLGEDTLLTHLAHEKLVKISSNNGDELSCATCLSDVKRICSEIETYCSNVEPEIHQACDIAKHIEPNRSINISKYMSNNSVEDADCNCENGCDLACAKRVTDVIVLPSAEAVLDTKRSVESHEQVFESDDLINKSEEQCENV